MGNETAELAGEVPDEVVELGRRARLIETPCGDGIMAWRIWGEGEPLVLAHGANGAWVHWLRNIDALAQDRMVILPDLPGHGDSATPETLDHAGISQALATGLKEILGDKLPVDLAGFSFGGVCLAYLARNYPEVARRLVLVDCGGLNTPFGDIDLGSIRGLEGEARMARLRANLLGMMLHHPDNVDDFTIWQLITHGRRRDVDSGGLVVPDKLVTILPELKLPVASIWAEFDRPHPNPPVQKAALLSGLSQLEFRVIESAGHWVMYEQPDAFNAALKGLLDAKSWGAA